MFEEPNPEIAKLTLADWLAWASGSRHPTFVKLARSIRARLQAIHDVLDLGLSNARLQAANTKLPLLTRLAFGFHSNEPLIALAMLRLGGLCPRFPSARDPRIGQESPKSDSPSPRGREGVGARTWCPFPARPARRPCSHAAVPGERREAGCCAARHDYVCLSRPFLHSAPEMLCYTRVQV